MNSGAEILSRSRAIEASSVTSSDEMADVNSLRNRWIIPLCMPGFLLPVRHHARRATYELAFGGDALEGFGDRLDQIAVIALLAREQTEDLVRPCRRRALRLRSDEIDQLSDPEFIVH